MAIYFEISWAILTIFCLTWATIADIKNRIVPDKVWLVQIIGGLFILLWWNEEKATTDFKLMATINIAIAIIFGYVFFMVGSWGGGDSKAIIATSISSPLAFSNNFSGDYIPFFPSIIYILANMMIGLLIFTFTLFIINIYQIKKYGPLFGETSGSLLAKINVLISAHRIPASKIVSLTHEDPAEIFENNRWKLYSPLFMKPLEDEEYNRIEKEARENAAKDIENTNRTYLWTRPQPPGLVFITVGYIYWIFFGSPLAFFLQYL